MALSRMSWLGSSVESMMGIDDKLLRCSFIEVLIALRGLVKCDNGCIDDLRDGQTVVQNGLHELTVALEERGLAGKEAMRLRPPESESHAQVSGLGRLVVSAWILCAVEAGNADGAGGARDRHKRIEHGCGCFRCIVPVRSFSAVICGSDRIVDCQLGAIQA